MANTRLCLGAEVLAGKRHAGRHALPGLWSLLDAMPRNHWPTLLRGDCGYGNEIALNEAEERGIPCLFKLRHTPKVKSLVAQAQRSGGHWQKVADGWEVMEGELKLSGWSRERRVVLVREAPALAPVGKRARRRRDYLSHPVPGAERWSTRAAPWSGRIAVLVATLDPHAYPAEALARLYR